ncbi:glyoxalase/bleomycin resistance/extradiol dioxygenase family protein [Microbacterium sp. 5K110]|jgi:PhnB protein|uniref:VOC family protein n=1 Tax=unclassified Microbacterium TaxID=2609290 RepID=UPI0010FF25C7|nr:glyoxalase/bleomycin resistance/extradiol dioxygenase family protein [Microbacterium sp. 5K110]TLF29178.1 glyoxalase/bleomycin resistance/extradiol dioxygenase family protein [Microbacterium sp. 5K110]
MPTSLVAYVSFAGHAREAMTFYQSVFGGELTISTFADFGMADQPADAVMHSELRAEGFTVMGADAFGEPAEGWGRNRIQAAFMSDEVDRVTGFYDRFVERGSEVVQALEKQVWGDLYGEVVDPWGVSWMFNIAVPGGWAKSGS